MALKTPIIAIVDDDKIFQLTASKAIKATAITDRILQFENGEVALQYLKANLQNTDNLPDYIFLDINMPFVDGWMFLDDYDTLKQLLAKTISIFVVSSSIDQRDIDRAKNNRNVSDYVEKPVTRDKFLKLLEKAA